MAFPTVAWSGLRNPFLCYPSSAAKDVAVVARAGLWHLFFSSIVDPGAHWRMGHAMSADLGSWAAEPDTWPEQPGTLGLASPDVTRRPADGIYVIAYQSQPGTTAGESKLYYRTSEDLIDWSKPRPLAAELHPAPGDRMIDAALAWSPAGLLLGYKHGLREGPQAFELGHSPSGSLDGPWKPVGRPDIVVYGDTVENYQFIELDGRWHLMATSNTLDRPWLFRLAGDPVRVESWLSWTDGRELDVPAEDWNDRPGGYSGHNYERANAGFLCDARRGDGYCYLFYAGSAELDAFGGWGHAKLGIARSRDLLTWHVPGDR